MGKTKTLFLGIAQTLNNGALLFCRFESKVTLCMRRNYSPYPGDCCRNLALIVKPQSDSRGSSPSLSGAGAWRPLGDVTLTLSQHN